MNFIFSQLKVGKHAKVSMIFKGQITHKKGVGKVDYKRGRAWSRWMDNC